VLLAFMCCYVGWKCFSSPSRKFVQLSHLY
jgi:hypothetical protein